MKRYDCWFCGCGRIHIMDNELYDWMAEDHERNHVVRVCNNCGAARRIFLTSNCEGWDVNGCDVQNTEIDCTKNHYRFIFSRGIRVPMKEGNDATSHCGNLFIDWDYVTKTYPNHSIYELEKKHPAVITVDTEQLIRNVRDNEIVRSISGYASGIDWSGTEYAL